MSNPTSAPVIARPRVRAKRGERAVQVPTEASLASVPVREGPLTAAEEAQVERLLGRCDNNIAKLLLLNGFKKCGITATTDFELDPIGQFFRVLCNFKGQEGMRQIGTLQTHVMPNARVELDFEQDSETLRMFSSEEYDDAVNTRTNYGSRCDFPHAFTVLIGDRNVPIKDAMATIDLAGGNKMQLARVTVGGVTFNCGTYGIVSTTALMRERQFSETTYPSAKAKIEEVMGVAMSADIRRNDELSMVERQLIHFLLSQFDWDKKRRNLVTFNPQLAGDIMGFTYVRRNAHKELLTWLREHLQPKVRINTGTIKQLNVLTMMDAIELSLLRRELDRLREKYGPNVMDTEVPQVVLDLHAELEHCPYRSWYYEHKTPSEAALFGRRMVTMANRFFGDGSVPVANDMDGIWIGLMQARRLARSKRLHDPYSYDRFHIDGFQFLGTNSSTARKGFEVFERQLEMVRLWDVEKGKECYAFAHIGTKPNNFTDLSNRLNEQKLPVFRFDLKASAKDGISHFDITDRNLPKILDGVALFVVDDTMPTKAGEVNYNYDHEDHNDLIRLKMECWSDILRKSPGKVRCLSFKDWLPNIRLSDNGYFLFDDYVDLLDDLMKSGDFDAIHMDNDNGRLGNSEMFVTLFKYPPGYNVASLLYGTLIERDEDGELTEDFINTLFDKMIGMLAYSTGIAILRTLGAAIWTLPPLREHDLGGVVRGKVVEYSTEVTILRGREDYDPLEEFCARCLNTHPKEQFVSLNLGALIKELSTSPTDQENIVKAIQRIFPNLSRKSLFNLNVRYGDLFAYWVAQSETAGHRLFRAPNSGVRQRRKVTRRKEWEDVSSVSPTPSSVEKEESVDPEELGEQAFGKGKEEETDEKPQLERTLTQQFTENLLGADSRVFQFVPPPTSPTSALASAIEAGMDLDKESK